MRLNTGNSDDGGWVSPRSVAARLGVDAELVRRAVRRGELVGVRVGRRAIRIRPADVQAWLDGMTVLGGHGATAGSEAIVRSDATPANGATNQGDDEDSVHRTGEQVSSEELTR